MATITKGYTETTVSPLFPGATVATHTFTFAANDVYITGASFSLPSFTISTRYNNSSGGRNGISDTLNVSTYLRGSSIKSNYLSTGVMPLSANVNSTAQSFQSDSSGTRSTSTYFKSSNPTERSIPVTLKVTNYWLASGVLVQNGQQWALNFVGYSNSTSVSDDVGTLFNLILDVPPTFDVSALSIDTSEPYAGVTTATVTVSNSTAYYGGSISSVAFTIGNQTETLSGDGTLSIALDTGGTFTPTVTVTDSRGQTANFEFEPMVVKVYTPPSVSFDVERTDSTGAPDDEGTYGLIEATLTFADVIADAIAPSVVLTDENGTQTTPTVTWYTDDTLTTTVTWSNVSTGDTVYGLFSGVNTQYSYSVSVRPRDSEGTGTAITQTLSAAFYTLDFLAGGHGIAFGKPASNVGFECAMDATFEDTLTAQDMTAQEVSDFVDSIGGGDPIADVVIEQGTDDIWTYRKWSSGIAECWGAWYGTLSHYSTYAGFYG